MIKPLDLIHLENNSDHVIKTIKMNHYLYINNQLQPLIIGEEYSLGSPSLNIHVQYNMINHEMVIIKLDFVNESASNIHIKLVVENYLRETNKDYAFISPKQDVVFITNDRGLYLTSGVIKDTTLSQYGIIKSKGCLDEIINGMIPFCPIGKGDVSGVYSLEHDLLPKTAVSAFTWAVVSRSWSEKELIETDKQLKSALAFLGEK